MPRSLKLNHVGDTIVEVLICMAIVGLALGGAFGVAVRSLVQIREAEERSQAIRLAQSQVELLQQAIKEDPTGTFASTGKFFADSADPNCTNPNTIKAWQCPPYGTNGFIMHDDRTFTDYFPPTAAKACNSGRPPNEFNVGIAKDYNIPGQFHVGAGFCLVGGGLAGGSHFDMVTFTVRLH